MSPTFEIVFVLACHYAISKLCKGKCHHYGQRGLARVPTSPHVHTGFDHMGTRVPLPGRVLPHQNAHGSPIDSALRERSCSPDESRVSPRCSDARPESGRRWPAGLPRPRRRRTGQATGEGHAPRCALVSMYNATIVDSRHIAYAKTKRATFK